MPSTTTKPGGKRAAGVTTPRRPKPHAAAAKNARPERVRGAGAAARPTNRGLYGSAQRAYIRLVLDFPLESIRDEDHWAAATDRLREVLQLPADRANDAYLAALTDLVHAYEQKHHDIEDISPADALRSLVQASGKSQACVAREVDVPQSVLSEAMSGRRELSKANIKKFAAYFQVPRTVFLD